jgi:hypothetical protein
VRDKRSNEKKTGRNGNPETQIQKPNLGHPAGNRPQNDSKYLNTYLRWIVATPNAPELCFGE